MNTYNYKTVFNRFVQLYDMHTFNYTNRYNKCDDNIIVLFIFELL